jgi:hypothetical protein
MVTAAIKFTQGVTVGTPGVALFGSSGTSVNVANGDDTDVVRWTFTVLDVPPGSSVPTGNVQDGTTPSWNFTPDHTDDFLLQLDVYDAGGAKSTSVLSFGVLRTSGRFIPAFSAKASALNFAGNARGWAPYMEAWLDYLDGIISVPAFNSGNIGSVLGVVAGPALGWVAQPAAAVVRLAAPGTITAAESGTIFLIDTSGGPFTQPLPTTSLFDGCQFTFIDAKAKWATNAFTLNGAGNNVVDPGYINIDGRTGATVALSEVRGAVTIIWDNTQSIWLVK